MIAISETREVSVSAYFVSENQITQPSIVDQVLILRQASLFSGELVCVYYVVLLTVGEKEKLDIFDEVCFVDIFSKNIPVDGSAA